MNRRTMKSVVAPKVGTCLGLWTAFLMGLVTWSFVATAQEIDEEATPSPSSVSTEEVTVTSGEQSEATAGDTITQSPALASPSAGGAVAGDSDALAADYNRTLRTMETKVNTLKEKVFRSKARLLLLRETVLHGVVSGAKAVLYHVNELGPSYSIESVTYFLDGSKIYSRADATGDLSKKGEIKIFEGNVPPGNHQVTVNLVLRGNGFGVFSYLNSYKFKVQHSYNFIAEEGKVSQLKIIAYEKNGLMRDFKDRPNIRYDLVTDRNLPAASESGVNP